MTAASQRFLAASAAAHVAVLALVLLVPGLLPRPSVDAMGAVLELIPDDLKLTDGTTVGGGKPDAPKPVRPPERREVAAPQSPPEPRPSATGAVRPPPAPPKLAETAKLARTPKSSVKDAQDHDPKISGVARTRPPVVLADKPRQRTKAAAVADRAAAEAEARELREKDQRIAAQHAAWERARRERAEAIRGAASNLGRSLTGEFKVLEMPGPGGRAYAPYGAYLAAFYKLRWQKPATLQVTRGVVGAEITVTRDGTVREVRIIDPSGIRALDDSVREVLEKNRRLRPLPEGATDAERTISILFDLSAADPG
jgi:TonB family protein